MGSRCVPRGHRIARCDGNWADERRCDSHTYPTPRRHVRFAVSVRSTGGLDIVLATSLPGSWRLQGSGGRGADRLSMVRVHAARSLLPPIVRVGQGRTPLRSQGGRLDTRWAGATATVAAGRKPQGGGTAMTTTHVPAPRAASSVRLRTRLLSVFLALHGVAHFAGSTTSLKLIGQGKAAEYLGGSWVVADPTTLRILAAAWAAIGIAFLVVAAMVWRHPASARLPLATVAALSLTLSVVALWAAVVGVVLNAILLLLAVAAPRAILADDRPWNVSTRGGPDERVDAGTGRSAPAAPGPARRVHHRGARRPASAGQAPPGAGDRPGDPAGDLRAAADARPHQDRTLAAVPRPPDPRPPPRVRLGRTDRGRDHRL